MEILMLAEDLPRTQPGGEGSLWKFLNLPKYFCFRVFDQYEIDIEITKHRHSYLNTGQLTFLLLFRD